MDKLYWSKVKDSAIIPTKREEDAGYDLYACSDEDIIIKPNENVLIKTGVASAFSNKYVGIIKERGSTGYKNMSVRAGVIDSGFRNEWAVIINNTGNTTIMITNKDNFDVEEGQLIVYPKSKAIAQVVFHEVPVFDEKEITYEELQSFESERGMGMLGDSGK